MIYLIADTHFGHTNIIKYCSRPFKNSFEMDEYIIKQWNNTVTNDDIVYHLGDFCFKYDRPKTAELIARLNGHKILVKGNHDKRHTSTKWKELGFEEAYGEPIVLNDIFILSHWPTYDKNLFNIHGHKHNTLREDYLEAISMCVSVELINYTPISIDKAIKQRSELWR